MDVAVWLLVAVPVAVAVAVGVCVTVGVSVTVPVAVCVAVSVGVDDGNTPITGTPPRAQVAVPPMAPTVHDMVTVAAPAFVLPAPRMLLGGVVMPPVIVLSPVWPDIGATAGGLESPLS